MALLEAGGGRVTPGALAVLFCWLVPLAPLRNGFLLPAPSVGLHVEAVETGMVALLLPGPKALLGNESDFDVCCGAGDNGSDGGISADGVGSSGMVGMG